MSEKQNLTEIVCINKGRCSPWGKYYCPIVSTIHNRNECPEFKAISKIDTFMVSWITPGSSHKSFMRAGKEVMGCGWCGHNQPEG